MVLYTLVCGYPMKRYIGVPSRCIYGKTEVIRHVSKYAIEAVKQRVIAAGGTVDNITEEV